MSAIKTHDQLTPAQKQMLEQIAHGQFGPAAPPAQRPPATQTAQTRQMQALLQQSLQQQADPETVRKILREH